MPVFDVDMIPTRGVGTIPKCFRKQRGTLRSARPEASFAARGPKAEELDAVDSELAEAGDELSNLEDDLDDLRGELSDARSQSAMLLAGLIALSLVVLLLFALLLRRCGGSLGPMSGPRGEPVPPQRSPGGRGPRSERLGGPQAGARPSSRPFPPFSGRQFALSTDRQRNHNHASPPF